MKTLILYSSTDGQTQKIAEFIAQHLNGEIRCEPLLATRNLQNFDRIIIGASIRYGHFNPQLNEFIEKNALALHVKRAAFFAVNLTARKAGKDTPETNAYVRKFLKTSRWNPAYCAVFAGALRYPQYDFFDRTMIRFIMKLTNGETNPTKEIEYTNWEKVRQFAQYLAQEYQQ